MSCTLFPVTYLGPVHYFARLMHASTPVIEQHCHYTRQTYHNRCVMMAANGLLSLTVPVVKGSGEASPIRDIKIAYDTPWQTLHWRSIVSAYQSSPYFEYYQDDFLPFYTTRHTFLFDFDMALTALVCKCIDMPFQVALTDGYERHPACDADLREVIHPKKEASLADPTFHPQVYRQLFADKFGFQPNLSIIDLLFNKGPESYLVLRDSIVPQL